MNSNRVCEWAIACLCVIMLICLAPIAVAGILNVTATCGSSNVSILSIAIPPNTNSSNNYVYLAGCSTNPSPTITFTGSACTTSGILPNMEWGVVGVFPPQTNLSTNFTTEPASISTQTNNTNWSNTYISTFPLTVQAGTNPIIVECEVNHDSLVS